MAATSCSSAFKVALLKPGEELVVVVRLPARVVDVGADLVTGDDGSDTTAGTALSRRDGNHVVRASRGDREGGGKGQNESREVLHLAAV